MDNVSNSLLNTKAAAKHLGVSESFLEKDRIKTEGLRVPFIRIGTKKVSYRLADLDAYISANTVAPISNKGA